ncbi:hypothetical protein [uncultured Parabacteroides sp.]|nr:hypothetical protein [uncultured Parabacteroides sp.]
MAGKCVLTGNESLFDRLRQATPFVTLGYVTRCVKLRYLSH